MLDLNDLRQKLFKALEDETEETFVAWYDSVIAVPTILDINSSNINSFCFDFLSGESIETTTYPMEELINVEKIENFIGVEMIDKARAKIYYKAKVPDDVIAIPKEKETPHYDESFFLYNIVNII